MGKSILVCLLGALLCGCSPATQEEVQRHVEDKYGDAEHIRTEEVSEDEIIYYFCDKEYGFEYFVKSYVNDIVIDGSKFGETESKGSNFEEAYYEYVLKQVKEELTALEEEYEVTILDGFDPEIGLDYKYRFAEVCGVEDDVTASQVAKKVNDLFAEYDTRKYWHNMEVAVLNAQKEKLGIYSCKYERWMTPEEERDVEYWERIQMLNSEAQYVRKEQKKFQDTGVALTDVVNTLGSELLTEESMVTYYYFTVDGKEYFLADFMVSTGVSHEWYTDYKEE